MTQKIALVTGAASGIGLAAAELLLKDGIAVVMADRSPEVLAIAKDLGARMGGKATGMVVELSREENVLKLARDVLAQQGRVDILVNNAGVHPKNGGNKFYLEEITSEQWATVLAINLTAPFLLSRELIPQMKARKWGRVINISSNSARTVVPPTSAAYVTSKHGIIGLTHMSAYECASHGVTVNAIAPGPVRTGLTGQSSAANQELITKLVPMGRYGEPMELAVVIQFLASDASSFITGAVLDVNGGSVII